MATVTVRTFRNIGEQWLIPLVKDLRQAATYALSTDRPGEHVKLEEVDVLVIQSGPLDVSDYDLIITIDAFYSVDWPDTKERARHVLQEAWKSLQASKYPQLHSLKVRADLKLSFISSASSDR